MLGGADHIAAVAVDRLGDFRTRWRSVAFAEQFVRDQGRDEPHHFAFRGSELGHELPSSLSKPPVGLAGLQSLVSQSSPPRWASSPRHRIQVNVYLIWRISSRNLGSQPARFRRVLTLPLRLLARTRPRAKRRTMAMFLAPCPVR